MRDHEDLPGEPLTPAAIRRVDAQLTEKIVRRHPHVFDSTAPVDIDEVERRYEAIKTAERAAVRQQAPGLGAAGEQAPDSDAGEQAAGPDAAGEPAAGRQAAAAARASFDSLPASVPALTRAQAVLGRIERLALDQPDTTDPDASGSDTTDPDASGSDTTPGQAPTAAGAEAELGRALFALVSQAHAQGLDAEAALRRVTSEVEDAAVEQARRQAVEGGDDTADARS